MMKFGEDLQCRSIAYRLREINEAVLYLAADLKDSGMSLEAINVEHWPRCDKNETSISIWDGRDHLMGANVNRLTSLEIIGIVKRRLILKRKF